MGNLLNRFGSAAYENLHDAFTEKPKSFQKVRRVMADETEKSAAGPGPTAKPTVDELRDKIAEIPAKKIGRPSKGKPWVEAGVSKASWYRQQKSKGDV
jgi:hypothetical protein